MAGHSVPGFFIHDKNHPTGEEIEEDLEDGVSLSVCLAGGKLGLAFYQNLNCTLNVVNDIFDQGPEYAALRAVFKQVMPTRVITHLKHDTDFGKVLAKLCNAEEDPDSILEEQSAFILSESELSTLGSNCENLQFTSKTPIEMVKLPNSYFLYGSCLREILTLRLPSFQENLTEEQQRTTLSGYVDLKSESCIRATGALVKYLKSEKSKNAMNGDDGAFIVISIQQFVPMDILGVEESVLKALQVFNPVLQSSASRFGSWNQQREGLSLFSLLNRCKSTEGAKKLNLMCRALPREPHIIKDRQVTVEFFVRPVNLEVLKAIQDCLKNTKGLQRIFKRIFSNQASVKDWKCLKSTLMNQLRLIEICAGLVSSDLNTGIPIIERIASKRNSGELSRAFNVIEKTFDEEMSEEKKRYVVLPGVDDKLDEKKRLHNGLPDLMHQVVQEEVEELPDCMTECSMVYVPHVGYMLAVKPWWKSDDDLPNLNGFDGLQFLFTSGGIPHFKSERCVELDEQLGDTATEIAELETEIMVKVTNFILTSVDKILELSDLCSELDVLISFSIVASQYEWVRPTITDQACSQLVILEGRHPLLEHVGWSYVPNSTLMGGNSKSSADNKRIIILTGHNACGKSVYLKQVGLIAFLAHMGSFVPAESAVVPLLHSIHTRIQTTDSIEVGLSSFAVDINQMAAAIRNSQKNSLILIDEFGKGTSPKEGVALLAATLQNWMESHTCPFIVVATHFFEIVNILRPGSTGLSFKTFSFEMHDDVPVQLFKLIDGFVDSSKAFQVAKKEGIDSKTIARATEVLECLRSGKAINPPDGMYDMNKHTKICSKFLNLDLESEDWREKIEEIFEQTFLL